MTNKAFIFLILFCVPFLSSAQEDSLKRSKVYKTWITLGGGSEIKGTIYQIRDSSILIANTFKRTDLLSPDKYDIQTINFNSIYLVTCRKEIWPGAVIGMVADAFSGVILGHVIGDSFSEDPMQWAASAELKAAFLGILFAIPGAAIGLLVTDIVFSLRIPISGNFENFNKNKNRLKKYSYLH
jgi:hypothetical protein